MKEIKVIYGTGTDIVGDTYYSVDHMGIQKAIDYANTKNGGKIFITKGKYLINNTNNSGGSNGWGQFGLKLYSNIELRGEGYGTVLESNFTLAQGAIISCIGTSGTELENIRISDLTIGGETKKGGYGIYTEYVGKGFTSGLTTGEYSRYDASTVGVDKINKIGITIKDCIVRNNISSGINLQKSNNCSLSGNVVNNNGSNGIWANSSSNNTISGNTVSNNVYGIHLDASSNNNIISGNTVSNNGSNGIYLENTSNNTISGNTVRNNGTGILLYYSNNNIISGNTVSNNNGYGIYSSSSTNNTVSGNIVSNNGQYGIYSYTSSNNTISGNIVSNNGSDGIFLYSSSNNTISGNNVSNNSQYGINLSSNSNNNTISGNQVIKNKYSNIYNNGTGNLTYNIIA